MHKGIYTIEKYKAELVDGQWVAKELVQTIEEENRVSSEMLFRFHENAGTSVGNMRVFVNEMNCEGAYNVLMVSDDGWIQGSRTVGGTYVAGTLSTDPYWYCTTTFNPPSVTRNIRSLATGDSYTDYQPNDSNNWVGWSILPLDTPCVQTNTEILQITYRMFYNRDAVLTHTNTKSYMVESFAQKMMNTSGGYHFQPINLYFASVRVDQLTGIIDQGLMNKGFGVNDNSNYSLYAENMGNISSINGVRQGRIVGRFGYQNVSTSADFYIGAPIRSVAFGYPSDMTHRHHLYSYFNKGTTSSVQNVFPKAAYVSGNRPVFLHIPDISLSPAKVNLIDNGLWVNNIDDPVTPYLYRINITTGGVAGVAEYKIQRRRIYYTSCNNWNIQNGTGIPTLPPYNGGGNEGFTIDETYAKRHGFVTNLNGGSSTGSPATYYGVHHSNRFGLCVKHYHYPQFIGFSQSGITIADVNGNHYTIDNYTTPSWNPTDILQLAHDGSTILVACGDTGLWKITRPFDDWDGSSTVITKVNPTGITNTNSCRGVTVKNIGAIVEFKILYGGTGYAPGDVITLHTEDAMGSGFAGTVATVGGLGNITSITITNPGSGYHEDNVAATVASTGGSGAKLVPIPGANGIWWTVFNDTADNKCIMAWTADAGATWTLYDETTVPQFALTNYTSGTPGPVNIIGIHIDPYHADDRFLIQAPSTVHTVTTSTSTNGQFFWWSRAGSTPSSNQVRANNSTFNYALGEKRIGTLCVGVLNDINQWLTKGTSTSNTALYTYGNAATTATAGNSIAIGPPTTLRGRSGKDVTTCHTGDSSGVHVYKNSTQLGTGTNEAICIGNMTVGGEGYQYYGPIAYRNGVPNIQYIGKGVYLGWSSFADGNSNGYAQNRGWVAYTGNGDGTNTSQAVLPYGHWENYGWNGTEWVLGNANSKVTHAAAEPLIDGLTISFDDNGGIDSYIVNEYYDGFVFDGMLNDNATTFSSYYNAYYGQSQRGDTFTPGTVPNSDVGSIVDEPFTVLQEDHYKYYTEPGVVSARYTPNSFVIGEQQLTGDFEFKFKFSGVNVNKTFDIGVCTWANVVAGSRGTGIMAHNMSIRYPTSSPTLQAYNITCRNSYNSGAVQTINVTDGAPGDVFFIRRVGTNLEFGRNGVVFRIMTTASSGDLAICMIGRTYPWSSTVYDATISYTVNRRYVDIGDGSTTGKFDSNYGRVNVGTSGQNGEFAIYLDGVPATMLTNGYTPPAAGEINWLRGRGTVWCNPADAGKVITGKWITALRLNYE